MSILRGDHPFSRIPARRLLTVFLREILHEIGEILDARKRHGVVNRRPAASDRTVPFERHQLPRRGPLEVRVMDVLDIPVQLELGSVSETVTVTAEMEGAAGGGSAGSLRRGASGVGGLAQRVAHSRRVAS